MSNQVTNTSALAERDQVAMVEMALLPSTARSSAQPQDSAIADTSTGRLDFVTAVQRKEALQKTGALQDAIFNSATFLVSPPTKRA